MNQTERLYKIDTLIRSAGTIGFKSLQKALEVSRATLNRDLAMLRDRMNAPIVFDREAGGYRFADANLGPQYELPGLWFSDREILALLTMHRMLEDLDTGGLLGPHIAPLIARLNTLLAEPDGSADEIRKRVRIMPAHNRPVTAKLFEVIGSALVKRRRLELNYFSRSRNEHSWREVSPQRLVHYRNAWYLDGWCHRSDDMRVFALDAVGEARPLDRKALDITAAEVDRKVGTGYGIFRGTRLRQAVLRFSAESARWVKSEIWHPLQQGRELDDGRWELRLPYSATPELEMDILRHAEQVEVVSPPALRERIRQRLDAAVALYVPAAKRAIAERPAQTRPAQTRPAQTRPAEARPTQARPTQARPTETPAGKRRTRRS